MDILIAADRNSSHFPTFFDEAVMDKLNAMGSVFFCSYPFSESDLCEKIKEADILITSWGSPKITEKIIQNAEKLKYILHTGGSVASVVTDAVYDKNITVMSGNEIFAHSVAEGVIAYILSALRHIPRTSEALRKEGIWKNLSDPENYNRSLIGKTVGIVSFGAISRYLIPMLCAFDVKLKLYSRKPLSAEYLEKYNITQCGMDEIFKTCDIVTVQTALNEHTRNMITKKQLSAMKDGAVFVNTARSGVVDTNDLICELKTGRISAVLDVFDREPIDKSSPFVGMENVFLMPHMCGPTVDLRPVITLALIDSVKKCEKGERVIYEIDRKRASEMTTA